MPILEIVLGPGESVVSESGQLAWINHNIELETSTAMGGSSGVFGAVKRSISGASFFMTRYQSAAPGGLVTFAAQLPGHITQVDIQEGHSYMVHQDGFMCGTEGIVLETGLQKKLGAGIFGGAGFIMQRVRGNGTAWMELGGEVFCYELQAGESLRVHPGHVGMFEEHVQMNFASIKGLKNKVFGGGLFLAELHGPGKVWLQSLSVANLAAALSPYMSVEESAAAGAVGGVVGGLLK